VKSSLYTYQPLLGFEMGKILCNGLWYGHSAFGTAIQPLVRPFGHWYGHSAIGTAIRPLERPDGLWYGLTAFGTACGLWYGLRPLGNACFNQSERSERPKAEPKA
jgi:hypothetical protein